VFDEPPEPADEPSVLDEPPEPADPVAVIGEVAVPAEVAVLDEPPPHAAASSAMPAVTARTQARRLVWEWLLSS
jgi:hypothetical protein